MSRRRRTPEQLALFRDMLEANGYNPDALRARISRKPTESEIRFGHGCRHYSETTVHAGQATVIRDGNRWTIDGYLPNS